MAVTSPRDGILQKIHVVSGQAVPASAALFEVIGLDTLWIRVPVSVSDRPLLNRAAWASVHGLAEQSSTSSLRGTPVVAPPTADPATATIDLYYEVPNPDGRLVPGEKVGVTISLGTRQQALVVPHASVLTDEHGGSWVYVSSGSGDSGVYQRHRVAVAYVSGQEAVLSEGPPVNSRVVTTGAAELFGTEFSAGH